MVSGGSTRAYGSVTRATISLLEGNQTQSLDAEFRNDLDHAVFRAGLDGNISYENAKWKLALNVPATAHIFNTGATRHTLNPGFTGTYLMDRRNTLSAGLALGTNLNSLDQQYPAYILQNYRNLQRYNSRILTDGFVRFNFGYTFMDIRKARSAYINYTLEATGRDYSYRNTLDSLGSTSIEIIDQASTSSRHQISGTVTQAFLAIKTNVRLELMLGSVRSDYSLNDIPNTSHTNSLGANFRIYNNSLKFVSADYIGRYHIRDIRFSPAHSEQISSFDHFLDFHFFLPGSNNLIFQHAYYTTNIKGHNATYFLDLTYRYRFEGWKADFDLSLQNLLDNRNYIRQYTVDYQLSQVYFQLRPRQLVLSVKFSF